MWRYQRTVHATFDDETKLEYDLDHPIYDSPPEDNNKIVTVTPTHLNPSRKKAKKLRKADLELPTINELTEHSKSDEDKEPDYAFEAVKKKLEKDGIELPDLPRDVDYDDEIQDYFGKRYPTPDEEA